MNRKQRALQYTCPKCGAQPGQACTLRVTKREMVGVHGVREIKTPHNERWRIPEWDYAPDYVYTYEDHDYSLDKFIELLLRLKSEGFTGISFDAGYNSVSIQVRKK